MAPTNSSQEINYKEQRYSVIVPKLQEAGEQLDKLMATLIEPLQEFTGLCELDSFRADRPAMAGIDTRTLRKSLVMVTEMVSRKLNLRIDFRYVEIAVDNERYLQINIHELNPVKWSIFTKKIYLKQGLPITSLQRPVLQYLSQILLVYTTL